MLTALLYRFVVCPLYMRLRGRAYRERCLFEVYDGYRPDLDQYRT
jgi:hypothetical protein